MRHDAKSLCCDESFVSWEDQEKDLSTSLTVRWSWKRKRWESDNAVFWNDRKNKWSCLSDDGKYYYGFRSFRALLKSYVGGILCEKAYPDWYSRTAASRVPRRGESPVMRASAAQVAAPPGEVVSSTGKGKYIPAQVTTIYYGLRVFLYLVRSRRKI